MSNVATAEAYYKAMGNKDLAGVGQYLHPKIEFLGPLANLTGKEVVLEGLKNLFKVVNGVTMRAKFGTGDRVMLAYDLHCLAPIGDLHVAALMTFKEDLIGRIELFYDARAFERK